jgi:hypothetical protein
LNYYDVHFVNNMVLSPQMRLPLAEVMVAVIVVCFSIFGILAASASKSRLPCIWVVGQ